MLMSADECELLLLLPGKETGELIEALVSISVISPFTLVGE
jgi:hypothetical protein